MFAGTYPYHIVHRQNRALSISDIPGLTNLGDHGYEFIPLFVSALNLYLDLRQHQIIIRTARLGAETSDIGYRHSADSGRAELVFKFFKLFGPNDALYLFHGLPPSR